MNTQISKNMSLFLKDFFIVLAMSLSIFGITCFAFSGYSIFWTFYLLLIIVLPASILYALIVPAINDFIFKKRRNFLLISIESFVCSALFPIFLNVAEDLIGGLSIIASTCATVVCMVIIISLAIYIRRRWIRNSENTNTIVVVSVFFIGVFATSLFIEPIKMVGYAAEKGVPNILYKPVDFICFEFDDSLRQYVKANVSDTLKHDLRLDESIALSSYVMRSVCHKASSHDVPYHISEDSVNWIISDAAKKHIILIKKDIPYVSVVEKDD